MSLIIFSLLAYIGPKAFKTDTYYGTNEVFERLVPIQIDTQKARRMERECPSVYMITENEKGEPTAKYLAYLCDNGLEEDAQLLIDNSPLKDSSLEEIIAGVRKTSKAIAPLETNPIDSPDSIKAKQESEVADKVITFKRELDKLPSKPAVIAKAKDVLGSEINVTENDGTKSEIIEAIVTLYKEQLGV
ncbi:hypothetical protein [Pseudoalteromonas sp. ASV78]|uniref:hypothetical protein n=1 Tax=Pseudoalteromonas sp. ASV78 TaxID=3397851 RepID=UPI0039FC5810